MDNSGGVGPMSPLDATALNTAWAPEPRPLRPDVAALLDQAFDAQLGGDADHAASLFERVYGLALQSDDPRTAVRALYALSDQSRNESDESSSLLYSNRIFDHGGNDRPALAFKGYLALGCHLMTFGDEAGVEGLLNAAERHCRASSLSDFCDYLELRAALASRIGRDAETSAIYDLVFDVSSRNEGRDAYLGRLINGAVSAAGSGSMRRAMALHEDAEREAERTSVSFWRPAATLLHASTAMAAGDFLRAHDLLEAAAMWPSDNLTVRILRAGLGLLLGTLTGDGDILIKHLDLCTLDHVMRQRLGAAVGLAGAALHAYFKSIGRDGDAAAALSGALASSRSAHGCSWSLLMLAKSGSAEDCARARRLVDRGVGRGPLDRAYRALIDGRQGFLLGAEDPWRARYREAAEMFSSIGWRYHQAVCLDLAGHSAEAREMCAALGVSGRHGAMGPTGRPRRGQRLSSLQSEIGQLVAEGLTNREIGQRLDLAERTVKYHVSALFDALGVRRRSELVAAVTLDPRILWRA